MRYVHLAALSAALVSGCSAPSSSSDLQLPGTQRSSAIAVPLDDRRCDAFVPNFDELVACRRADGTLQSFTDPDITWRVRYFVRYWQMPCGEMPTVEEAYVFHMVTNDLYGDESLNDSQRLAIRTAMFDGTVHCR